MSHNNNTNFVFVLEFCLTIIFIFYIKNKIKFNDANIMFGLTFNHHHNNENNNSSNLSFDFVCIKN